MKRIMFVTLVMILAVGFASATVRKNATGITEYIGLSSDTKPSTALTGYTYLESDTGRKWVYTGAAWIPLSVSASTDTVRMTAPGYSAAVSLSGYTKIKWDFTLSNVGTSVVAGLQERSGSGAWTTINTETYATDGDYGFLWSEAATADSARFYWVSESGGTSAEIVHTAKLSGEVIR